MKLIAKFSVLLLFLSSCQYFQEDNITCQESTDSLNIKNIECKSYKQVWTTKNNDPNSRITIQLKSTGVSHDDYWDEIASNSDMYRSYSQFRELNPYLESYKLLVNIYDDSLVTQKDAEISFVLQDSSKSTTVSFRNKEVSSEFTLEIKDHFIENILNSSSIALNIGKTKMEFPKEFRNYFKTLIMQTRTQSILL